MEPLFELGFEANLRWVSGQRFIASFLPMIWRCLLAVIGLFIEGLWGILDPWRDFWNMQEKLFELIIFYMKQNIIFN